MVNDRVIDDGVEGQQTTVDVLDDAFNPFPDSPLTVVGATVETPGAGTAGATRQHGQRAPGRRVHRRRWSPGSASAT